MATLREQLWPVVKEYTRQVKELMGVSEAHWIGTDDNGNRPAEVLDLGGVCFLSFEDVQVIVDNLGKWVDKWGSREAVAKEIRAWEDWWLDDVGKSNINVDALQVWETRRERYLNLRPRIELEHWLKGSTREPKEPDIIDRVRVLRVKRELVVEMAGTYRGSRSLWNVIDNLTDDINKLEEKAKDYPE